MKTLLGQPIAQQIEEKLINQAKECLGQGITPTLGILLVGNDKASALYVRNKQRAAERIGIAVRLEKLPATVSQHDICTIVKSWNKDKEVHGIIIQLPLPDGLIPQEIISSIDPKKDVDGMHRCSLFTPPTPAAVRSLLRAYDIPTVGADIVIIGRSALVGMPLAQLLLSYGEEGDATVTVCHRKTKNLMAHTKRADILISAAEQPGFITKEMIKPGVVLIDVGMRKVQGVWKGDVDETSVEGFAGALSPVPGGVGPLTVACLLSNVLQAAKKM